MKIANHDPLHGGLRTIAEHMSLDVLEVPRVLGPGAGEVLDGLRSHGYINEYRGRVALSERGERALSESAMGAMGVIHGEG